MVRANATPALPAQKLVNLVAAMDVSRILLDGGLSIDDAGVRGNLWPSQAFGEFSLTPPH
jgi:hypothetical protein